MTSAVRIVQDNSSQNLHNTSVLRSGTTVTGRVLSSNGNGSYTVSLAGQMLEVKSGAKLVAGQVFQAKVSIVSNQVRLSLLQEAKSESEAMIQKFTSVSQNLSPELQNLLSSLGFEPNAQSFKILQFIQQIGIKIDVESAKKALAQSKKDGRVNQEKAEILLLLDEKGIHADDKKVNAILGKNQNEKRKQNDKKNQYKPKNLSSSVKKYFESVDSASLSQKTGVLTAFNTILSGANKNPPLKHWLILPFEWNYNNYSGDIRLLFDSELKNLEKIIINLKNNEKSNIFVLYYKNTEIEKVRFASDSADFSGKEKELASMLSRLFSGRITVEQCSFSSLCGFCSDDESFATVSGSV